MKFIKAFQNRKKDGDLHVTKGDHFNVAVIMNKDDYISKVRDLLNDYETYEILRSDPLQNVNSNFSKKMKSISNGYDELVKQFSTQCAKLPYFLWISQDSQAL